MIYSNNSSGCTFLGGLVLGKVKKKLNGNKPSVRIFSCDNCSMSFRKPYTDSNNNNYIYLGEFYLYQNPLNLLCFQCCCFCLRPQKPSFKYGKNGVSNFRDITDINFLSWVVVAALPKVCQIDHAHWTWTWNLDIGPEHFLLGYKPWHWTLTLSSGFAQGIWTHMLSLKFYLKHQVE